MSEDYWKNLIDREWIERTGNWREPAAQTLQGIRPVEGHTAARYLNDDLGRWLRENTLRVRVPDPNNEPRIKVWINADRWKEDIERQAHVLKQNTLILVQPYENYGFYLTRDTYVHPSHLGFIPLKLAQSFNNTEAELKLTAKAQTISLRDLGHISLVKPKYISPMLFSSYVKYAAAQAILDNIAVTEGGLCAREWFPHYDFLDGYYDRLIHVYDWYQPVSVSHNGYDTQNSWIPLYRTDRGNCHNDRKVYFFYGFKNLKFSSIPRTKDQLPTITAARDHEAEVWIDAMRIEIRDAKLIDIPETSSINDHGCIFFQRPILFRRSDDMNIQAHLRQGAMGKMDRLKPLGFVIESLGAAV